MIKSIEKLFDKIQHLFMIKMVNGKINEGVSQTHRKHTQWGKYKSTGTKQVFTFLPLLLNIVLEEHAIATDNKNPSRASV